MTQKTNKKTVATLILVAITLTGISGCNLAATSQNVQGRQAFEQGQYNEAIKKFQTALQRNPANSDAIYNLASTYHLLGKQTRNTQLLSYAEQLYRQAISVDQNSVDAHRALAVLLIESNRQDSAFDLVRTWHNRNPNQAEPLVELARLYQEYGDRSQATEYLADALAIDSQNSRALNAMGQIREANGEYQLALENYTRSYQANNMQPGIGERISRLQSQLQSAGISPVTGPPQNYGQPGQVRLGSASQYVPH